jgi:hypothetical protein
MPKSSGRSIFIRKFKMVRNVMEGGKQIGKQRRLTISTLICGQGRVAAASHNGYGLGSDGPNHTPAIFFGKLKW